MSPVATKKGSTTITYYLEESIRGSSTDICANDLPYNNFFLLKCFCSAVASK